MGGYLAEHWGLWLLGMTAYKIGRIGNHELVLRNEVGNLGRCSLRMCLQSVGLWLQGVGLCLWGVGMWQLGKRSRHRAMRMVGGLLRCGVVQLSRVARKQLLWLPLLLWMISCR